MQLVNGSRTLGVGITFDNYGTGIASLSLLKRYPVTRLKFGPLFVRDLHACPKNAAVVSALLYFGRSLGMDAIAEGVKIEGELGYLKATDCT